MTPMDRLFATRSRRPSPPAGKIAQMLRLLTVKRVSSKSWRCEFRHREDEGIAHAGARIFGIAGNDITGYPVVNGSTNR